MYYSLILIFLCIPLYFSHFLAPFGVGWLSIDTITIPFQIFISDHSSFERQKVFLFFLLIFIALIEWFFFHTKSLLVTIRKYGIIFLILAIIPFFSQWINWSSFSLDFYLGWYEKHHGYIFFVGILLYVVLLLSHSISHLKWYLFYSFLSAIVVAGIAIGEYLWWVWDIYGRSEMMLSYTGRSSSTLGNPNYLAGFLVMYIPIIYFYFRKYRSISWLLFLVGIGFLLAIFTTGSYIALFIILMLGIWYQIRFILHTWSIASQLLLYFGIITICIYIWWQMIDETKLLSLESRFILMKEVASSLLQSHYAMITGFWPDSILTYFTEYRSVSVNSYFPQNMLIDSSHNALLDIWYQYGVIPIFCIFLGFWKHRSQLVSSIGIAYVIGITFLFFNVFVLIHILLLALFAIILLKEYQQIHEDPIKKSK